MINLIVKDIWFGKDVQEFNRSAADMTEHETVRFWRKFDAVGKLHNTVKYIMRSHQRHQRFKDCQMRGSKDAYDVLFHHARPLFLQDGGVCWNSTYSMMFRALQFQEVTTTIQEQHVGGILRNNAYSAQQDQLDD